MIKTTLVWCFIGLAVLYFVVEMLYPGFYGKNLFIAVDQFINALFFGDPDDTISARLGRAEGNPIADSICWFLDLVDENHCANAVAEEGA